MALSKPAFQSSHYSMGSFEAALAVDGNARWDMELGGCTMTRQDPEAYWAVDLGRKTRIHAVVITTKKKIGK